MYLHISVRKRWLTFIASMDRFRWLFEFRVHNPLDNDAHAILHSLFLIVYVQQSRS